MNQESFDCVEMKQQIQEKLRADPPKEPLDAWNEAVRNAMLRDPHLCRFKTQLVSQAESATRKAS